MSKSLSDHKLLYPQLSSVYTLQFLRKCLHEEAGHQTRDTRQKSEYY